jgi:hypothetical protein
MKLKVHKREQFINLSGGLLDIIWELWHSDLSFSLLSGF